MPIFTKPLPLSLYIHLPWCVRKCPYCDFNSHQIKDTFPEEAYVDALLSEFEWQLPLLQNRSFTSIFFGGGTPSLFSAKSIRSLLEGIQHLTRHPLPAEITLEANPGTVDQERFYGYRAAGVNRLSLGVQSFHDEHLTGLGRIHDKNNAVNAINIAKKVGFENFNIDIMHGLPQQSIAQALNDLAIAVSFQPTHISWYQLTIEPNTLFHHQPPVLPDEDLLWDMQVDGQAFLAKQQYAQYEVSAYAQPDKQCQHNINYWQYGDYLGIGAGAHSKITHLEEQKVYRFSQTRHPKDYLNALKRHQLQLTEINPANLMFEYLLNALRLKTGTPFALFNERTGLDPALIQAQLQQAQEQGLLMKESDYLCATALGQRFLNNLTTLFLPTQT